MSVRCSHFRFSLTKVLEWFLQTLFTHHVYHIRFISAGSVWNVLHLALNWHACEGHRSRLRYALIFSLIKFTLPVSSTPSCDEWLTWLWGPLSPGVKPLCVCVRVCVCVSRAKVYELWPCVSAGGRALSPWPLILHPLTFYSSSLSFILQRPHLFFFCYVSLHSPFLACFSALFKMSESAETRGRKAELPEHRGPLSLLTGPLARTHLSQSDCFWGLILLYFMWTKARV